MAGATQNPETMDILSVAATAHNQKASFSPVKGGRIRKGVGFLTYEMRFSVAATAHNQKASFSPVKGGMIRKGVGFLTYEMRFSVAATAHKAHGGLHQPPKDG